MSRVLQESSSRSRQYEDAEAPVGHRNTRDSLFPAPGCSIWTRKMKDHAFRSRLSSFFQLPVKVTGVDPTVLRQLGEALEMIRGFVCGSGAKDLLKLVNYRILFPWLCTIPIECTLALREVDIGLGWELVDSPQLNRLNNPACPLHWRVLLTILRLLDRTQQDAMWEYRPTNIWTVCGYVPPPVLVASVVPAFVVEGPEDLEEYTDTLMPVGVSHVEPQPFLLRDYRTGRRVGVLANSVRSLQDLALQHFAIRDPLLALDNTTQIICVVSELL